VSNASPCGTPTGTQGRSRRVVARSALLLGYGKVNQAVADCLERERPRLEAFGLRLSLVRALVRDLTKPRGGPVVPLSNQAARIFEGSVDVVVEALGGVEPARTLVLAALDAGVPVVSANKSLVAAHGPELRARAAAAGTAFVCDAAVLAGVPFLGALSRRPLVSRARRIEGILNGTSHTIVSALARGATFDDALADAIARGYAEPDSAADVSGRDAAEKLTILLHLTGRADVRVADLATVGINVLTPDVLAAARRLGGVVKPVALASLVDEDCGAWVGPAFVDDRHPFARLDGVTNALRLTTAYGTCTFSGPGAGPVATAATIVDDLAETLRGGDRQGADLAEAGHASATPALDRPMRAPWLLHVSTGTGLAAGDLAEYLAVRRASATRIDAGDRAVTLLTAPAPPATIDDVLAAVRGCGAPAVALPVLDGGRGE
jgi:homoserine dehydrogenase